MCNTHGIKIQSNADVATLFDVDRVNFGHLNEVEVRKQYQIKISNRFAALENLGLGRTLKRISKPEFKESLDLNKLKQHKVWFDEECIGFLDQMKQAKMQWLQDPNQSNVYNLNHVRSKANRHSRNKKKEYLKAKIEELETNSKIKNIRDLYMGIIDFKKGYQPTTNAVKDEKGDVVADSYSIVAM